ncbi:MAG: glutamate 5-kinase [Cyanobacteria bacterium P01_H01_bin.15]
MTESISESQTLVVKIGTSSLTELTTGDLNLPTLAQLVETVTRLRRLGHRVILVSSGAVGVGCNRLNLSERPRKLSRKQAIAAVGQGRLIRIYDDLFAHLDQAIAQVLLTRQELIQRSAYVNVSNTFQALFELGVVPIVNENDTVATEELRFGDNDSLSALVASLVQADWLFLLTDVDRLYSADPRFEPNAHPITHVAAAEFDQLQVDASGSQSGWGTGGMATKLAAARIASHAGVRTVIMKGSEPDNIMRILGGESLGTQFAPQPSPESARKRWIVFGLIPMGKLYLDAGAAQALRQGGKSLLPAGIVQVEGEFGSNEAVLLCTEAGEEIGRGLVNYSDSEIRKIRGHRSENITELLGYAGADTVIHRDNLALQEVRL